MNYGFFRVCCCSPEIQVANTEFNAKKIIECVKTASEKKASIIVFPELSVTGYTCHDLFLQKMLQDSAINAIEEICEKTKNFSHTTRNLANSSSIYNNKELGENYE